MYHSISHIAISYPVCPSAYFTLTVLQAVQLAMPNPSRLLSDSLFLFVSPSLSPLLPSSHPIFFPIIALLSTSPSFQLPIDLSVLQTFPFAIVCDTGV
jgi:hypothetical protein